MDSSELPRWSYVFWGIVDARKRIVRLDISASPELSGTKETWIKRSQREAFSSEIMCSNKKTRAPRPNRILTLPRFPDSKGILRAGGRISKAPVSYATRHPIILSPKCHITKLLITNYHQYSHHEGNGHVHHAIQLEFWILNYRATISHLIYRCPYCRRRRVLPQVPIMADITAAQLVGYFPPFLCVRLDYFGPFAVKWLRKAAKRLCCLFTCLVNHAMHIEVEAYPGEWFLHHGPAQDDLQTGQAACYPLR